MPVVAWAYVKPLWKEYIRIRDYEYYYLRLRRMPVVIRAMLSIEPAHSMDFIPDEIHLGTVNASIHITIVMDLFCKSCADNWNILNRWLETYHGLFWLTVRFIGYNSKHVTTRELVNALTGIYIQSGDDAFCKAMTDWNENRDSQKWKMKYYANQPITPQSVSLKTFNWLKKTPISVVPSVFVGDKIYRDALSDLEYLLKE